MTNGPGQKLRLTISKMFNGHSVVIRAETIRLI